MVLHDKFWVFGGGGFEKCVFVSVDWLRRVSAILFFCSERHYDTRSR